MCTKEGNTGTKWHPALLSILALLVVPIGAKRFHRHYSRQPALLNRHCRGPTTAVLIIVFFFFLVVVTRR